MILEQEFKKWCNGRNISEADQPIHAIAYLSWLHCTQAVLNKLQDMSRKSNNINQTNFILNIIEKLTME